MVVPKLKRGSNSKVIASKHTIMQKCATTFWELRVLLSFPVLLIVFIAALDNADKELMKASFPILQRMFGMDMKTLGYFSLFTNLSYSLSLPIWGGLVHRYGVAYSPRILACSCFAWGASCLGIAGYGSSVTLQAIFRAANGAAIASILPLSQAMLIEFVPPGVEGRAFGLMGLAEKMAGALSSAWVVMSDAWQIAYVVVGVLSISAAACSWRCLSIEGKRPAEDAVERMSMLQTVRRISGIPAFVCLVGQGVFGAIPWDMMSFLLVLLDWKGFSRRNIASFQVAAGCFGMIGTLLGGILGDYFAYLPRGRIYVAIASVVLGIVFYALFLFSNTFEWCLLWYCFFNLVALWVTAAANRPICSALARNPSERAQIVAMWILLEKTSAAVFGAPLVGYLSSGLIDHDSSLTNSEKASALAWSLFSLSTLFWMLCTFFWVVMAYKTSFNAPNYKHGPDAERLITTI